MAILSLSPCLSLYLQGFMTSVGNRQRRVHLAMQLSLGPLVHGILTSGMAVFMLSTSPFEFVIRHFCWLLLVVLCVGACNSLVVFPILLSMLGPEAELVPLEHPDRISTPSPVPMRSSKRSNKSFIVNGSRGSSRSNNCHKAHHYHKDVNINDPSLTTITEEPQSWKSSNSSIQMHNDWSAPSTPTPTHNRNHNHNHNHNHLNNHYMNNMNNYQQREPPHGSSSSSSSGQGNGNGNGSNYSCNAGPPPQPPTYHKVSQPMLGGYAPPELQSIVVQPEVTVETTHSDSNTTKVTATANIKVELVTPGRAVRSYNFTS